MINLISIMVNLISVMLNLMSIMVKMVIAQGRVRDYVKKQ